MFIPVLAARLVVRQHWWQSHAVSQNLHAFSCLKNRNSIIWFASIYYLVYFSPYMFFQISKVLIRWPNQSGFGNFLSSASPPQTTGLGKRYCNKIFASKIKVIAPNHTCVPLVKKLQMWDIFVVGQLRFNRRHQNSMEKMIKRRWQNTSPKGGKTGMSQLCMPYMPLLSIIYISIRCVYVHHILYQVIPLWIPPFLRWFYDFLELCFPPTKREHLRSRSHRF